MPARVEPQDGGAVRQIVTSSTDADFLEHLIEGMRHNNHSEMYHSLDRFQHDRDMDIERMCTSNHQEFVNSVNRLDTSREESTRLGNDIMGLVQSYQESMDRLATQKKSLVDSRSVRHNIDESADALKECLEVLRLANQVHDLVGRQNHYAALRALDELQNTLGARESAKYSIGDLIEKSIPATQKMIAEAVMADLNTWLYRVRDVSQYIGEVAFYFTEQKRQRQRDRIAIDGYLGGFKINSAIETVADELEEFDILNNDEAQVHVDFTPLFECIHIHDALGQSERFRLEYANTRRRQRDLIIPSVLRLNDEEASELKTLLEGIAGFAIVERGTMTKTENLRNAADVDELWDSMCQSAISLMSGALQAVENSDTLLRVTGVVSLFIQTMESYGYYAAGLTNFLMTLFERYATILKNRCADDFQEIVSTDDYMPMPINSIDEYDKIIDVGWYTPEKAREEVQFPCVLPFSQMYPMCCIDIRNFLNQVYSAPEDYMPRSSLIDETVKNMLDELLCDHICQPLIGGLLSQYPGQIVQILTNLEHFEKASEELQSELGQARTARSKSGPVVLRAVSQFRAAAERAKARIYELVNSKIDELIETAEYDWTTTQPASEPTGYMVELTQYLSNIMNSVLLGLPAEVKDQIYYGALNHAASHILAVPLDAGVTAITPACVRQIQLDISHFAEFISNLSPTTLAASPALSSNSPTDSNAGTPGQTTGVDASPIEQQSSSLRQKIIEITQTVELMASDNPDSFYDIAQRNSHYPAVNAQTGAVLLEKVEAGRRRFGSGGTNGAPPQSPNGSSLNVPADIPTAGRTSPMAALGNSMGGMSRMYGAERLGGMMRGLRRKDEGGSGSGNT